MQDLRRVPLQRLRALFFFWSSMASSAAPGPAISQAGTVWAFTWAGSFPWANLPDPSMYSGKTAQVTDYGVPGVGLTMISDGTRWLPLGPQVLAHSNASVAAPADTSEDTLATITLPPGILGIDGSVRVRAQFSYTNSANAKTLRLRFGGTIYNQASPTTTSYAAFEVWISNRGAANAQIGGPSGISTFVSGGVASSSVTSAIDTTVATPIVLTEQKALGSETVSLDRYIAEVWP